MKYYNAVCQLYEHVWYLYQKAMAVCVKYATYTKSKEFVCNFVASKLSGLTPNWMRLWLWRRVDIIASQLLPIESLSIIVPLL